MGRSAALMNRVTLRRSAVLTCKTKHKVFSVKGKGVHGSAALVPACPCRSSPSAQLADLSKSDGQLVNVVGLCSSSRSESAVVITESRWDHDFASLSAPSSGATKPSLTQGHSVLWGGKDSGTLYQR